MECIKICGGIPLKGKVKIQGAKNAALPVISATVLSGGKCVLENCPDLSDTRCAVEILRYMGAKCEFSKNTLVVDTEKLENRVIDSVLMSKLRSSITFAGAIAGRFGEARLAMPGGCELGPRPIDMHIEAFRGLGMEADCQNGYLVLKGKPKGGEVVLAFPSVGATQNAVLAAVLAEGSTTVVNCAKEPEIVCMQNFLNLCGAKISGGGSAVMHIEGVKKLHGARCVIDGDRIAAATYMACFVSSGGAGEIYGVDFSHMTAILAAFEKMGAKFEITDGILRVKRCDKRKAVMLQTQPYPGFPTDCLPIMTALSATVEQSSIFSENIFKNRFHHVGELAKFGAEVHIFGKTCVIKGKKTLSSAAVDACDLRGGASAVIAALNAHGESVIKNSYYIDRGYENICEVLNGLGANISKITVD